MTISVVTMRRSSDPTELIHLPVHHSEFQNTCLYYQKKSNMFIVPEVLGNGMSAECTCYIEIYNTVVRIQDRLGIRPSRLRNDMLSESATDHLNALLEKVASANMAERITNPAMRQCFESEIPENK